MKSSAALLVMIGISTVLCIGCGNSGVSSGGGGQQAACSSGSCSITPVSGSGASAAPAGSPSGWPCYVTVYQSGQIGVATGSGSAASQSPNATCGLGAAPTGGSAFSCYVEPTGQTQPSLGWCLLSGSGSGASPSPGSSTSTSTCTPSSTTSVIQLSVSCLTLTVGQTQSVTLSESGYSGMFSPSVANGATASSGISSTQNNTFTFTGTAAGTTSVTFSDTSGHTATMQIVVNAAAGSSPAPTASSLPSLGQIVPTTGSGSSGFSCPSSVQQGAGSSTVSSCGTGTAPAGAISPCFITNAAGTLVSGWCLP